MIRCTLCVVSKAILTQVAEKHACHWYYTGSRTTTKGLQAHMNFAVADSLFAVPPACSFYGSLCARSFEARENGLIHWLI